MGKSLFIVLAVCLMSSGAHGDSESMSCSMVNGKTICNRERNKGDTAMSSSSAFSGPQGESMNTFAGAGNPMGDWQSSGQRVVNGNGNHAPSNDYFDFDNADFQGDPGGFDEPIEGVSSYSSSGSAENLGTFAGPMPTVGGFDEPIEGVNSYSSSGSAENLGTFAGPMPTVGGFGFASAGNFFPPGFPFNFVQGTADTHEDSSEPNGGSPDNRNFGYSNSGHQEATGEFGGPSLGGFSYSYSSSGSAPNFNANVGPAPTVGGFGFTSAGNAFPPGFPFNFNPGFGNAPQVSSRPNGGGFAPGGFAPGGFGPGGFGPGGFGPGGFGPGGFGPGGFVPGGFAGAGAGAGAGAYAGNAPFPMRFVFGRR